MGHDAVSASDGDSLVNPGPGRVACVTGAAGFIGTHVVRELLNRGYRVRATVRDVHDAAKTGHLRQLAGRHADALALFSADLLHDGSYDEAVSGCNAVFHVASAVYLTARDPQREIVDVAVCGTKNVLDSVVNAGSVKAVGLTSSEAAIIDTRPRPGYLYTEDDWTSDATLANNPYGMAKVEAERAAWQIRDELPAAERYSLMVVNPVLVTGPACARVHLRSSLSVIRDVLLGTFKGCPDLGFGIVDVRDVARALVDGVEQRLTGRHILHSEWMRVREIAHTLAAAFPEYRVPTNRLPNVLLYLAAIFDKRLTWTYLRYNLGRENYFDNRRVQRALGLKLMPARRSIVDSAHSIKAYLQPPG